MIKRRSFFTNAFDRTRRTDRGDGSGEEVSLQIGGSSAPPLDAKKSAKSAGEAGL
jgi:hypothetical protein